MSQTEKHEFKAEIQQLLDIVINSLYTDKEIFVRELVSNASDALEKLRFKQSSGETVTNPDMELKIQVEVDEEAKTVSFSDTGIGMTKEELVTNLGTIAHSGSKNFLSQLAQGEKPDSQLIGQFGVGFYSAFMVAEKVEVHTRSCQENQPGLLWTSSGAGSYEISESDEVERGSKIVIHLKEDQNDFAEKMRIESILKKHSSFVPFPLYLGEDKMSDVQALWTRSKNEITDEEYEKFFQHVGHGFGKPRYRLHFSSDAPLMINSILFVPESNMEKMGLSRMESQVSLYCKRVLIEPNSKNLLPDYLRFLSGVVDSEDIPLNISRESMQDSALLAKINKVITSRLLKFLNEESKKEPEKYNEFFNEFGRFIREGLVSDHTHRESLAKLLRYESSSLDAGVTTSLEDYMTRMKSDQNEIYFLNGPDRATIEASPYFEAFKKKDLEVLFFSDPTDEFVMDHLTEFKDKKVVSAEKAEISIDEENQEGLTKEQTDEFVKWLKDTLGEKVGEVKASTRLVGSPCLLVNKDSMTAGMRQFMKSMKSEHADFGGQHDLEINPAHGIIKGLFALKETDTQLAQVIASQVLQNAQAAAGLVEDPRTMVEGLNNLVNVVLEAKK